MHKVRCREHSGIWQKAPQEGNCCRGAVSRLGIWRDPGLLSPIVGMWSPHIYFLISKVKISSQIPKIFLAYIRASDEVTNTNRLGSSEVVCHHTFSFLLLQQLIM